MYLTRQSERNKLVVVVVVVVATSVADESTMNYFCHFREHEDRALMSLAAVLHHSKHSLDSVVLLHSAMGISNEQSVYHFLLGNIYSVS